MAPARWPSAQCAAAPQLRVHVHDQQRLHEHVRARAAWPQHPHIQERLNRILARNACNACYACVLHACNACLLQSGGAPSRQHVLRVEVEEHTIVRLQVQLASKINVMSCTHDCNAGLHAEWAARAAMWSTPLIVTPTSKSSCQQRRGDRHRARVRATCA